MRKIKNSDDAVAGIVVAILLVGLFVTIFSIIQTVYVPQWMEEKESEHMGEVTSQFAYLKFATDVQLYSPTNSNLSISVPITLGSDKIPYLLSERSYGDLDILSGSSVVTIKNSTNSYIYNLGTIKYSSRNSYFVDQTFSYETGAVIVSQHQGNFLSLSPFFSVNNSQMINISFTLVNISSVGSKTSANGYSTTSILTKYLSSSDQTVTISNITNITINTSYPSSWKSYFNETLEDEGLDYGLSSDYWITYSEDDNWIILHFNTSENSNSLDLSIKKISAQITPGWIN
jgi:hypothetical protein